MIRRQPPIVLVASAYGSGIAGALLTGTEQSAALVIVAAIAAPILVGLRPWPWGLLSVCVLAGALAGRAAVDSATGDCRLSLPRDWSGTVEGRFLARPADRSSTPFLIEAGAPGGCRGEVRAVVRSNPLEPAAPIGRRVRVSARWEGRSFPDARWADRSGVLWMEAEWQGAEDRSLGRRHLPLRGALQTRIASLWGESTAPLVEALVLARREHLDPDLRDAFSSSGTAHLLAISGFHVGVVAVLFLGILRGIGFARLRAEAGAVVGSWLYVLGIGSPQAAVRAALLMSLLLAARVRGRPVSGIGALSSALLLILFIRPDWLGSVGVQLSFAGTAGLVLLRRPITEAVERALSFAPGLARASGGSPKSSWVKPLAGALGAGVAATLATTPLVAWHFGRVSLVGIPLTLVIGPIVALAIPGIGAAVGLSVLHEGLGRFLAGGVGLLLEATSAVVTVSAALPGASLWVSRSTVVTVAVSGWGTYAFLRRRGDRRLRTVSRCLVTAVVSVSSVVVLPLLPVPRVLEVHMIDVGQGDAIAVRLPSRRWLLVDAGPRSPTFDAGERRVVPYLRREGVRRLAAMVLTHPHLDHIGGAPAVLRSFDVEGVIDPGYATGSPDYFAVLEAARDAGSSWWVAADADPGRALEGVTISVLHPEEGAVEQGPVSDLNDLSVVVLVEWEGASLLLTGDASTAIERTLPADLPPLTVLKVGHHGSRTSTSAELLARARPSVALIGVGDGNRFGHPHTEVVERLLASGADVYRTDRDGNVRVTVRPGGRISVLSSR